MKRYAFYFDGKPDMKVSLSASDFLEAVKILSQMVGESFASRCIECARIDLND